MEKKKNLLTLFFSTFYISAFTFGGGFVIVSFMKRRFVDDLHWLEEDEMLNITAIAQSGPGPIAVNAAIQIGWNIFGFPGMLVSVLGTILPPLLILSVITFFYSIFAENHYVALVLKGMQAGVAAVICDVVIGLGAGVFKKKNLLHTVILFAAFAATWFFGVNVLFIILGAAAAGIISAFLKKRKEAGK